MPHRCIWCQLWKVEDNLVEDEMSGGGTNIGHKLIDFGPRIFLLHLQVLEVDAKPGDLAQDAETHGSVERLVKLLIRR